MPPREASRPGNSGEHDQRPGDATDLNMTRKPDIIERPLARSTMTAWMFIATSMAPTPAPNDNSAAASTRLLSVWARTGSAAQISIVAGLRGSATPTIGQSAGQRHTGERASPKQSSSKPSVASSRPARSLAKGMSGAQGGKAKPAMKNAARWRPVAGDAKPDVTWARPIPCGKEIASTVRRHPRAFGNDRLTVLQSDRPGGLIAALDAQRRAPSLTRQRRRG